MPQSNFKDWVNSEVAKKLDEQRFSSLPLRMRIGIFIIIGSFLISYGYPIAVFVISALNHGSSIALLNGSIIYVLSWIAGAIGLSLAGKDCIKYPIFFLAKLFKMLFPRYFAAEKNDQRDKKRQPISGFHMLTALSLLGIIIVIIISLILNSNSVLILGVFLIVSVHQAIYVYGMFSAGSNLFFKTVKGKDFFQEKCGVLFRFDDGPDPLYTPQILDILKAEGIQGLFAIIGAKAEKYPEIVERIHRENHIIANHTYSHPYNILFLSYYRIKNEITNTNNIIQSIIGAKPRYFCPPVGFKNQIIGKAIKELELIPVMWDIRTLDTKEPFDKIMARVWKKFRLPAIIMFHDGVMPSRKKDRESTVLALKETIRLLKEERGINFFKIE